MKSLFLLTCIILSSFAMSQKRPGLNIEEGVVRIHLPGKHAAKFELGDPLLGVLQLGRDIGEHTLVLFGASELEQLSGFVEL